ncbi:hypothetical protein K438DRAFT_1750456 [Mycena galopus ATCC 62051]|nr:hypothetical protein K438DRAFT_1750456 [Mycena galopus ATCC 62051]
MALWNPDIENMSSALPSDVGTGSDPIFATTDSDIELNETPARHSSLPPVQDDESEFGFEIPAAVAPGPIPTSYNNDLDDLEYIDDSNPLPGSHEDVEEDSEILPAAEPLGVDTFVTDTDSSITGDSAVPASWDCMLVPGQATRAGQKCRVYETKQGCECGDVLTDAECTIHCIKAGCETEWASLMTTFGPRKLTSHFAVPPPLFQGCSIHKNLDLRVLFIFEALKEVIIPSEFEYNFVIFTHLCYGSSYWVIKNINMTLTTASQQSSKFILQV